MIALRRLVLVLVFSLLASCGLSDADERSPTPLPGKIVWALALHPETCRPVRCQATYVVRIVNHTHHDAVVQGCEIAAPNATSITMLPVMEAAGLLVRAGTTRVWRSSFLLSIPPRGVRELSGLKLTCPGLDPNVQP